MKLGKLAAPALAVTMLAGCGASTDEPAPSKSFESPSTAAQSASSAQGESAAPTPSSSASIDSGQAWADEMITLFLNGNSKSSFADFDKELPHHYIESWRQESDGVLGVSVRGDDWSQCELDSLSYTVMSTAGWERQGLSKISVTDDSPNQTSRLTAKEYEGRDSAIPESCG